ncbi:aminoacyl tRNA synthase complex-interacting multifunctional protein 2 isoform X2 [Bacillus rossius redtenbacheri]|uniref:aminoacyl tRNA synthase complex-interacting multifunctional protein 2 isoform X2 n=1 Tax=Bacillus rossius redtenbacheri TaxID=93214 RepID=UPI002FDE0B21
MNEPTMMYTIKPIIRFSEYIDLPKCMYAMKNIQKSLAECDSKKSEKTMPPNILEQGRLPEVCVLESRQEAILEQLSQLKKQMAALRLELSQSPPASRAKRTTSTGSPSQGLRMEQVGAVHDVVLSASPSRPPYAVLALSRLWGEALRLTVSCHVHSSVARLPSHLAGLQPPPSAPSADQAAPRLNITLIWKDAGADTELVVSPLRHVAVRGEPNALRYLMRLGPPHLNYELTEDAATATALDGVIDASCLAARGEPRALLALLGARLSGAGFLLGRRGLSVADLAAWSALRQLGAAPGPRVAAWFHLCSATLQPDA